MLRALYEVAPVRVARWIAQAVFAEATSGIAALAAPLQALLEFDFAAAGREAFLVRLGEIEQFQADERYMHAIAAHQAAGLLDPRVGSPLTLAAAALETASYAFAERTTGATDPEVAARWEDDRLRECRRACEASASGERRSE